MRAVRSLYDRCQSQVRIAGSKSDSFLCEAAGMRIGTNSEAMVLSWKKVECLLQVGVEILPQVEELKYLKVLEREIGAAPTVTWTLHRSVVVDLCSPLLWSRALGSDQKNKIAGTSC